MLNHNLFFKQNNIVWTLI